MSDFNPDIDAIIIGSDHGGYAMKQHVKHYLCARGIVVEDIGTDSEESVDYPIYAGRVARAVASGTNKRGIAICGTGIGASIAANRFRKVRAALCITPEMGRLCRAHNNANVLVLGGRITTEETADQIIDLWLTTPFEGKRHARRVEQLDTLS